MGIRPQCGVHDHQGVRQHASDAGHIRDVLSFGWPRRFDREIRRESARATEPVDLAVIDERRVVQHLVELQFKFAAFLEGEDTREYVEARASIGVEDFLREAAVFVEPHGPPVAKLGGPLVALPSVGFPSGLAVAAHSRFCYRLTSMRRPESLPRAGETAA